MDEISWKLWKRHYSAMQVCIRVHKTDIDVPLFIVPTDSLPHRDISIGTPTQKTSGWPSLPIYRHQHDARHFIGLTAVAPIRWWVDRVRFYTVSLNSTTHLSLWQGSASRRLHFTGFKAVLVQRGARPNVGVGVGRQREEGGGERKWAQTLGANSSEWGRFLGWFHLPDPLKVGWVVLWATHRDQITRYCICVCQALLI